MGQFNRVSINCIFHGRKLDCLNMKWKWFSIFQVYIYIYRERERERERKREYITVLIDSTREYITVLIDSTSKMNRCKERKTNEDVVFGRERERERGWWLPCQKYISVERKKKRKLKKKRKNSVDSYFYYKNTQIERERERLTTSM